MNTIVLLDRMKTTWTNSALKTLAKGVGVREDLRGQVERFYDLMLQVLESGDHAWLDPLLQDWASSLTQTDLEEKRTNLIRIINELMVVTIEVCRLNLPQEDALQVVSDLAPCFAYAFDKATEYEMQVKIDYVSSKLTNAQQTLERLERSKSDFIAVAAHELKTPLTLVDGYAAMLRETLSPKGENSTANLMLDGISNGTNRLRVIVDDMIDVSLIDNNLLSLNFQPVWLNRLFQVLHSEFSEIVNARKQLMVLNDFPGFSEMTFGDPERLLQVFRNVLTNAVKFTPDGGKIDVSGRKLNGFIEITICDTGIGIAVDDQSLIFEKFSQLGNSSLHSSGKTKYKGGGPGLGLHIAKGIVDAHGGAIWVESPGCDENSFPGSAFHIILPLSNKPPDDRSAKLFTHLLHEKSEGKIIEPLEHI
jgi:signal transduction histidine kinase